MTSPTSGASLTNTPRGQRPFSLLGAFALLLEGRRLVIALGFVGGVLAVGVRSLLPRTYTARAMFMANAGAETDLSALRGLAGQFGLPIGDASTGPSPEFYEALARSTVILRPIAAESVVVAAEQGAAAVPVVDILRVRGATAVRRVEKATEKLQRRVAATYDRRTGIISLRVRTRWPELSKEVGDRILRRVNDFNLVTRQSRARAERVFAEGRVAEARVRLRAAEDSLLHFAERNRSVAESPILSLEQQRRAREVTLAQQVLASLEPSLEEARLREVKDTPVITILQAPTLLSVPDPRGRIKFGIFGGVVGLLVALVLLPARQALREAQGAPDAEAQRFFRAVAEMRGWLRRGRSASA